MIVVERYFHCLDSVDTGDWQGFSSLDCRNICASICLVTAIAQGEEFVSIASNLTFDKRGSEGKSEERDQPPVGFSWYPRQGSNLRHSA